MRLDGINQTLTHLKGHFWIKNKNFSKEPEQENIDEEELFTKDCSLHSIFHREILARLSFLQISLQTVDTIACHGLSFISRFTVGLITFNKEIFLSSRVEFVSLIVQAVCLPFIAAISFFLPVAAIKICRYLLQYNQPYQNQSFYENPALIASTAHKILAVVLRFFAIPLSCIRSTLRVPISLLSGRHPNIALKWFLCIVVEPLVRIGDLLRLTNNQDPRIVYYYKAYNIPFEAIAL